MRIFPGILTISFCCLFLACTEPQSVEDLIEQAIEERIEKFKEKKRKDCWTYINFKAEEYVDSIMYLEIGFTMSESKDLPSRPVRPGDSIRYRMDLDTSSDRESWVDTSYVNDPEFIRIK